MVRGFAYCFLENSDQIKAGQMTRQMKQYELILWIFSLRRNLTIYYDFVLVLRKLH